jgi:CelD/BcsL family acetyltransferase involved in cellulose biosynthesis
MFRLNLDAFKADSYFHDQRFMRSFERLAAWLHQQGLLRITAVLIGGKVAAVDIGALLRSEYTVLAGGTAAEFPGVAKAINLFHIRWACEQGLDRVDFLCGDFNWKQRFHLFARPLFKLEAKPAAVMQDAVGMR